MRAIAKYSFTGDPFQRQLTFPISAKIFAKANSEDHGWMWGIYDGNQGWFPVSYVELQERPVLQKEHHHYGKQANLETSYPVKSNSPDSPSPGAQTMPTSLFNAGSDNGNDQLMGGEPGDFFGVPAALPSPAGAVAPARVSYPTVIHDRGVSAKYMQSDSRDAAIYITDKISDTPTERKTPPPHQAPIAQKHPKEKFWTIHPPRVHGPPRAEQAIAVEQAFESLKDADEIKIVNEPRKRHLRIPKKLKRIVGFQKGSK
jgi:hypothetical protein